MSYKLIFTIAFLLLSNIGFTQNTTFSKEELAGFEKQAKGYLIDFTNTVKALGEKPSNSCDKTCLRDKVDGAIKLFKPGATVETITLKKKRTTRTVSMYLNSVVANYKIRYKLVIISFENVVIDPNSIKQTRNINGQMQYQLKGRFSQTFCVTNNKNAKETNEIDIESSVVCETTNKEFDITLLKKSSASAGTRWVVLLGNITVKSIRNLKND